MAREKPGQTLDATALVHEAYLRLVASSSRQATWTGAGIPSLTLPARRSSPTAATSSPPRPRPCAASSSIAPAANRARSAAATRSGTTWTNSRSPCPSRAKTCSPWTRRCSKLAQADPQAAELVQLRFFAGFSLLDAAEILGVSPRTAHRLWAYARAYLHREMQG